MDWKEFYDQAKNGIAISDGAMGTLLQSKGLTGEMCPELWNIERPEEIIAIQKAYVEAGAQMLTTNSLGGNRIKLANYGLEKRVAEINAAAIKVSKLAAGGKAIVTASIGPTGKFIEPIGPMTFEEMVEVYKEQILAMAEAGADALNFETHVDILELKAAIIAAKEVCDLPIIANVTFEKDGRTVTGTPPEAAFTTLEALGADIVGTNCSTGPAEMATLIERVRPYFDIPLIAQANAGIPHIHEGRTVFDELPDGFAIKASRMAELGANIIGGCCGVTPEHIGKLRVNVIGGCCGTTPDHIRRLKEEVSKVRVEYARVTYPNLKLSSRYMMKVLGFGEPFAVIGERLNPTARKKLAEDVRSGSFSLFKDEALAQEAAGADVLDMNMGIPDTDEAALVKKGIEVLSMTAKVPFAIDSANPDASRIGMRLYPGKPLLNSISAEEDRLALLPDVKKYGAAFVALPVDENGIPETPRDRLKLLNKIIDRAEKLGIDRKNIIADPLVLTVSANPSGAKTTLETIRLFTEEAKVLTTMGLSNVSFGLPARQYVNRTFLAMAAANGLTSAILNPLDEDMMGAVRAANVLLEKDANAKTYIETYAESQAKDAKPVAQNKDSGSGTEVSIDKRLRDAVLKGNKESIVALAEKAVAGGMTAIEILNGNLIPAITEVGDLYEKKIYFLPQLMMSAETVKTAFTYLEPKLREESAESKGKVVIATVKGDVHDIGKNIVAILLRNHGYEVTDLGKDVPAETILEKAVEIGADVVGLSALMTTTMPRMQEFMKLLNDKGMKIPVLVGGAAVTKEFADSIGARYSRDAVGAVRLVGEALSKK